MSPHRYFWWVFSSAFQDWAPNVLWEFLGNRIGPSIVLRIFFLKVGRCPWGSWFDLILLKFYDLGLEFLHLSLKTINSIEEWLEKIIHLIKTWNWINLVLKKCGWVFLRDSREILVNCLLIEVTSHLENIIWFLKQIFKYILKAILIYWTFINYLM